MPAMKCPNGKWKFGMNGRCIFMTKADAEKVGTEIDMQKQHKEQMGNSDSKK